MDTRACQLTLPDKAVLYAQIEANASHAAHVAQPDVMRGRTLTICGAGPSLADHIDTLPDTDDVWACNSAIHYLPQHGARMTHGFAIDQGEAMLGPAEWETTYDVGYFVASSVHPRLVEHLRAHGRRLTFFHSYLGLGDPEGWVPPEGRPDLTYEMMLYTTRYATSVQVGFGLNAVPRAICLALFLGYDAVTVVGADCACAPDQAPMPEYLTDDYVRWLAGLRMYADGRTAITYGANAVMAEAVIDGVRWHTRPDMVISAMHLLDIAKAYPHVTLVGHTLPNALRDKDATWLADMPRLGGAGDVHGFGRATPLARLAA